MQEGLQRNWSKRWTRSRSVSIRVCEQSFGGQRERQDQSGRSASRGRQLLPVSGPDNTPTTVRIGNRLCDRWSRSFWKGKESLWGDKHVLHADHHGRLHANLQRVRCRRQYSSPASKFPRRSALHLHSDGIARESARASLKQHQHWLLPCEANIQSRHLEAAHQVWAASVWLPMIGLNTN